MNSDSWTRNLWDDNNESRFEYGAHPHLGIETESETESKSKSKRETESETKSKSKRELETEMVSSLISKSEVKTETVSVSRARWLAGVATPENFVDWALWTAVLVFAMALADTFLAPTPRLVVFIWGPSLLAFRVGLLTGKNSRA